MTGAKAQGPRCRIPSRSSFRCRGRQLHTRVLNRYAVAASASAVSRGQPWRAARHSRGGDVRVRPRQLARDDSLDAVQTDAPAAALSMSRDLGPDLTLRPPYPAVD